MDTTNNEQLFNKISRTVEDFFVVYKQYLHKGLCKSGPCQETSERKKDLCCAPFIHCIHASNNLHKLPKHPKGEKMKEIMFNRKDYKSYENFYADVYKKLDGKRFGDFDYCKTPLGYNPDTLDEFLWYCLDNGNKYIFVNFDKEKIKLQKNYDDYMYNIIIEVFEDFVKDYPNNTLEFRMDDKK